MALSLAKGDTRLIITECKKLGLLRNQCAYVLATAWHESAYTMKPVRETLAKTDAGAKAALTKAWKAGKLPQVKADYWSGGYYGRGYPQVTHAENYARASKVVGVDLLKYPDRMMEPTIAVAVMLDGMVKGWFRKGHTLARYITRDKSDFYNARDIINGDKKRKPKGETRTMGTIIAGYAERYDAMLKADGYDAPKPAPKPADTPITAMAMSLGDKGPVVAELKRDLNILEMGPLVEDDNYDAATKKAVEAFQATHKDEAGKPLKVDGIAGPRTTKAIAAAKLAPKLEQAKKNIPPTADKAVKEESGLLKKIGGWLTALGIGGSGIAQQAFGADWKTVLAIGGVALAGAAIVGVGYLIHRRLEAKFDAVNAEARA